MGGFSGITAAAFGLASGDITKKTAVDVSKQWRPPQWSKPFTVLITVPAKYTAPPTAANGSDTIVTSVTASTAYVFDAVLSLEHEDDMTVTHHPVQTGSDISSHAYVEPAELTLYVLMSDVAAQYTAENQTKPPYVQTWTGNPSKSVSAYQQMLALRTARVPLTITTRLRMYRNMLITKISAREDEKTIKGARFRLHLREIFVGSTQDIPVSSRPNDTQSTGLGSVSAQPVPPVVDTQFGVHAFGPGPNGPSPQVPLPPDLHNGTTPAVVNGVPGYLLPTDPAHPADNFVPQYPNTVSLINVPGAGAFASVNTNSLQQIPQLAV